MLREEILNLEDMVQASRDRLWDKINRCEGEIWGIGAPSRASTIIHYCGLENILDAIVEIKGSPKIGKMMPGTNIPVYDEDELYEQQPPYAILFSWHLASELIPKIEAKGYRGEIILPV